MACRDVRAGTLDRLMRAPTRSKAEARVREGRVEDGREDLEEGLLNESVEHRGDAQHPHALPIRFGNLHAPDGLRDVRAAEQLLPDTRPVLAAIGHQVIDGHAVDAWCPTVAHHARVCGDEILSPHDLLDEGQSLVSARINACRARLTRGVPLSRRSAAGLRSP